MSTLADILDQPETSGVTSGVPDTPIKGSIGAVSQKRGSQLVVVADTAEGPIQHLVLTEGR